MANAVSMPSECFPKIFEFLKKEIGLAQRVLSLKGNNEFYNGAKPKKNEIDFLGQKKNNFVLEYTKRCAIATLGGYVF